MQYRHPLGVVTKVVGLLMCGALFWEGIGGSYFLVALAILLLIPVAILWRLDRPRIPPGHCATCGYDLTGNTSGRCPECGEPVLRASDATSAPRPADAPRATPDDLMTGQSTDQDVLQNRTANETRPE